MAQRIGKYKISKRESEVSIRDGGTVEGALTVTGATTLSSTLTRLQPETLCDWNYIDSPAPLVSFFGSSAADVLADGDQFSIVWPKANGGTPCFSTAYSVGAFTVAGTVPTVIGTIPATDTATTAAGLNLQMDNASADNVGVEIIFGGNALGTGQGITVGTHSATFDATFQCPDWSDFDNVSIGFRKLQAFQSGHGAVLAAASGDPLYTDFVSIGSQSSEDLQMATALNDGSNTFTDSTDALTDGQNLRVKISVTSAGVVTYEAVRNAVAGGGTLAAPSAVAAYTFDSGDVLVPYISILGTNVDDKIHLKDIKITRSPGISYTDN